MLSWLFTSAPVVYTATPEERFETIMSRLDDIEALLKDISESLLISGEEDEKDTENNDADYDTDEQRRELLYTNNESSDEADNDDDDTVPYEPYCHSDRGPDSSEDQPTSHNLRRISNDF
ncbi:hypothetical protein TetV_071 [Tetraselmis virus 1]|uniref:Uncharacterized protein n=1 Tax=Tetraselmis virus 1 TaxID=2060617 RepID=A0A2P0VMQ7_9VIRU|nr:hypothetical protein QJ968_gp071 [Tetraselmis virus 1]AUF82163.1 hypothetical protein TetV_071 [Tetraselmis virus 1]